MVNNKYIIIDIKIYMSIQKSQLRKIEDKIIIMRLIMIIVIVWEGNVGQLWDRNNKL